MTIAGRTKVAEATIYLVMVVSLFFEVEPFYASEPGSPTTSVETAGVARFSSPISLLIV
jgi:hypothetical protein